MSSPTHEQPIVGGMVHYVSWGSPVQADGSQEYTRQCRAAVVTSVGGWVDDEVVEHEDGGLDGDGYPTSGPTGTRTVHQHWDSSTLALHVMNPTGVFLNPGVPHDPGDPTTPDLSMCTSRAHCGGTWHRLAAR